MKLEQLAADPRVTVRKGGPPNPDGRGVVYWMQRAQRARDNPALDLAVEVANELRLHVVVFFAPMPFYPNANLRHYAFLAQGIADIAADCERRGIGFVLRRWPEHRLAAFCEEVRPALVIGDENPLREPEQWRVKAAKVCNAPLWTVDADVIVPTRLLEKAQYAARTIRPRLKAQLVRFLVSSRNPKAHVRWQLQGIASLPTQITFEELTSGWPLDRTVTPVASFRGGNREAERLLRLFIRNKLASYDRDRNHPEVDGTSRLSPYLHFGHISPVTVALAVQQADVPQAQKDVFLDQLITWRELSINFVRYQDNYDSFECGEAWAHRTLMEHAHDPRPAIYSGRQLEDAETHDELWNAAQRQMVTSGWMHNYMRMYWAKKILEWSKSPAQAFETAVRLNDCYFLDGRDPNGYAGIAWAIVGKFDRAWPERPVFGKIRYMSGTSTGKKFNSRRYIEQWKKTSSTETQRHRE
jgi:deoxyribodipyrimidine photo-lyase